MDTNSKRGPYESAVLIVKEIMRITRDLDAHEQEAQGTPEQQRNYDALCEMMHAELERLTRRIASGDIQDNLCAP